MQIRRAHLGDLALLVEHNRAMALETEGLALDPKLSHEGVRRLLAGEVAGEYFLAVEGAEALGQLMITYEWSDWRARQVWWIQSVFVAKAHRGKGVYRALYAHVEAAAREAGAAGIRLYVDERNTSAQAVYTALGMDGGHYRVFEAMFAEPGKA